MDCNGINTCISTVNMMCVIHNYINEKNEGNSYVP